MQFDFHQFDGNFQFPLKSLLSLKRELAAHEDEHNAAEALGGGLPPVAEEAPHPHAHGGEDQGGAADEAHGGSDVHAEEGEGDADGQGVDAGGHRQGEHGGGGEGGSTKAIQWSTVVMRVWNRVPRSQPMAGMRAWKPPNHTPQMRAWRGATRPTDSPLQMDTAKASMLSPTAMMKSSHRFMLTFLPDADPAEGSWDRVCVGAQKKRPICPKQISLVIENRTRSPWLQHVGSATQHTRRLLPYA